MKTILVIREYDYFSRILAESGFKIINLPLIETLPIKDLSDFEAKFEMFERYDGIFLTSAKAAEIFRAKLIEKKGNYCGKVYVLGRRSYEMLKGENLDLRFEESANTAREMLENIAPEDLKGKRFLFVRGEKSLRVVPDFLAQTATVDETIVYETREMAIEVGELKSLRENFEKGEIAAACFFSPSGAESFIKQFGAEITHQTIIAAIGKTTADYFERRNLSVGFISLKATAEDFAIELIDYLTNGKWKMENGK